MARPFFLLSLGREKRVWWALHRILFWLPPDYGGSTVWLLIGIKGQERLIDRWEWCSYSVLSKSGCQYSSQYRVITSLSPTYHWLYTLLDHSLSQLANFPTRKENTLDIFATNWPSLVTKCKPIPGISDHEAILLVSDIAAKIQPSVSRKHFLWWKANFSHIKEKIWHFSDDYLLHYTYHWSFCKQQL